MRCTYFAIVVCCQLVALPARAASPPLSPVISSVDADEEAGTIRLRGLNFPARPLVYMGRSDGRMTRLQGIDAGKTEITASLATTVPGGGDPAASYWFPWTISDHTSGAAAPPYYGTCCSCHDPHGTPTTDMSRGSNHMLRYNYNQPPATDPGFFCVSNCHG